MRIRMEIHALPLVLGILGLISAIDANGSMLRALQPRIQQETYVLKPVDNGYKINLRLPEGSSTRDEHFVLVDEVPSVVGKYDTSYHNPDLLLVVTYEAGKNGYVAKYKLVSSTKDPDRAPLTPLGISANGLKTLVG